MSVEIGNVASAPGTKCSGFVRVLTMADGGDLVLPVHVVTGSEPGPTLCLTAALHGDETDSVVTVMEIVKNANVDELRGTIVAVPVCNPPSFEACTYHTPMDGMNLEFHAFPGDPEGTITQRIAYALAHEVVTPDRIDVLVDVHSTPHSFDVEMNHLYLEPDTGEIGQKNEELSMLLDYEILYRGAAERWPGSLVQHASDQGIPNCRSEGKIRDIENVMKHLEMIPGEPILPEKQVMTYAPRIEIRPGHGGIIYPEFSLDKYPDQIVPEGALLARLVSPYTGEELEQLRAPCEAAVFLWVVGRHTIYGSGIRHARCNPGGYAYLLGRMENAEWIRR